jgi:hypothetical protein
LTTSGISKDLAEEIKEIVETGTRIDAGRPVVVRSIRGLTLKVAPFDSES